MASRVGAWNANGSSFMYTFSSCYRVFHWSCMGLKVKAGHDLFFSVSAELVVGFFRP